MATIDIAMESTLQTMLNKLNNLETEISSSGSKNLILFNQEPSDQIKLNFSGIAATSMYCTVAPYYV